MSNQTGKNAKTNFTPRSREQKLEAEVAKLNRKLGLIPNTPNNWKFEEFPKAMGEIYPLIFGDASFNADGIVEERVLHRPYGKSIKFDEQDWAISKIGDVRTFFEKRENPDFSKIQAVITKAENDYLLSKGLVTKGQNGHMLYPTSQLDRQEEINRARGYYRLHKSVPGAQVMNLWFGYMDVRSQKDEQSCLTALVELYKSGEMLKYLHDQYKYEPTLLDKTKQVVIDKYRGVEPEQIMSRIYDSICCPDRVIKIEKPPPKFGAQLLVEQLPVYAQHYQLRNLKDYLDSFEEAKKAYNKAVTDKDTDLKKFQAEVDRLRVEILDFERNKIPETKFTYFYPLAQSGKVVPKA